MPGGDRHILVAGGPDKGTSTMANPPPTDAPKNPLREIVQPFIDLVHAPRALWGINFGYLLEGLSYFGVLTYLGLHFSDFIFAGVPDPNTWAHYMVMVLTAGITLAMFFLGFVGDKYGVRRALILAFILLILGRGLISAAPTVLGLQPMGLGSALHLTTMAGIVLVVIGYGMYQPAAYAAIRQFTTPRTAGMAFAMIYALMNLGGYLNSFAFLLRDKNYANLGIPGTYWVYTGLTAVALLWTAVVLSRRTVEQATAQAREETQRINQEASEKKDPSGGASTSSSVASPDPADDAKLSARGWFVILAILAILSAALYFLVLRNAATAYRLSGLYLSAALALTYLLLPRGARAAVRRWLKNHPLADARFAFFIFALMPVQTLFTYNWLILPQYVNRSYEGWIGEKFEIASNLNALLVFVFAPILAALTQKRGVYSMMILGTFVMAAPAYLLAVGTNAFTLFGYILFMTIGESIWQPRFLQYAAQIAPEGRTGQYMGVAQLPWFMTKMLVPLLYSGRLMDKYCPAEGTGNPQAMWFIFACIAMITCVLLVLAKPWVAKGMKTQPA